ncbi:unnamed protein product [Protopolystoma xenopodis]|uniref:Uncharacterized protein n=1 Tax=Protopolystoma xenopodis TaxID=117903 RepID=A0A3S5B7S7_9PLAT|nr:unnamed protein product [Protopolystoma xenopodis]
MFAPEFRDSPPSTDLNLANNEQLMADRRRRAALLVARLKQEQFAGSSPPSTIAEEACFLSTVSTSDRPQTGKNSDCRFNSNSDPASPNPAIPLGLDSLHSLSLPLSARPDSVSIAVAQAVVAGLNRAAVRHESTDPFLFELNHDESSSNSNLVDLKDCPVQKKKKHRSFKQENGHRSGSKSSRFTKMTHRHERTPPAAYNADTRTLKTKYSKYIHQYSSRSPSSHSSVNCESDASESKSLPRSRSHHSRYEDRPGHKRHRD